MNVCDVVMVRAHLRDIPEAAFPDGFGMRSIRPGEAGLWAEVWCAADGRPSADEALFVKEFGNDWGVIGERCFFVVGPDGGVAGTISAWFGEAPDGGAAGRVHWVAVRPAWQGRGLARAALAHTMRVLARRHGRAYLATQSDRVPAIRLYRAFGFEPFPRNDAERRAWEGLAGRI